MIYLSSQVKEMKWNPDNFVSLIWIYNHRYNLCIDSFIWAQSYCEVQATQIIVLNLTLQCKAGISCWYTYIFVHGFEKLWINVTFLGSPIMHVKLCCACLENRVIIVLFHTKWKDQTKGDFIQITLYEAVFLRPIFCRYSLININADENN